MQGIKSFIVTSLALLTTLNQASATPTKPHASEILIDAVVASVNGKPITLNQLTLQNPSLHLSSLSEASANPLAREALDKIIFAEVLEAEGKARHISVSTEEVEQYIGEVSKRNNMSRAALEGAVKSSGRSFSDYQSEIKLEILKGKIIGQEVSNSVQISDEEIDDYIKLHGLDSTNHDSITLRQYTDGTDPTTGLLLSDLKLSELNPKIVDAVAGLKVGDVTEPVDTDSGTFRFKVESKSIGQDDQYKTREEAREKVKQSKVMERAGSFLQTDIFKKHSINRVF